MKSNDFLNEDIVTDAHEMHTDHEVQMAREELYHAAENAIALHKLLRHVSETQGLEAWVSSKITLANDYLKTVREYLEYELMTMSSNDPSVADDTQLPVLPVAETKKYDVMVKHPQYGSEWEHATKIGSKKKHTYSSKERAGTVAKNLAKGSSSEYNVKEEKQGIEEARNPISNKQERELIKKGIFPSGAEAEHYRRQMGRAGKISTRQMKSLEKGKRPGGPNEREYANRMHADDPAPMEGDEYQDQMDRFLSGGGKIQDVPTKPPRKSERLGGSRHIGGMGDRPKSRMRGISANTQGTKVVGLPEQGLAEGPNNIGSLIQKLEDMSELVYQLPAGPKQRRLISKRDELESKIEAMPGGKEALHKWGRDYNDSFDESVAEGDDLATFVGPNESTQRTDEIFADRRQENFGNGVTVDQLDIGDDVIITGPVRFEGATGVIDSFGRDKRFVVVNLYNHGKHSFHSSDVEGNDYAGSDEEEESMAEAKPRGNDPFDFEKWMKSDPASQGKVLKPHKKDGMLTGRSSWSKPKISPYERRVRELEAEGLTRSDAQGVADLEGLDDWVDEDRAVNENASGGASSAGAVAAVNNPASKKAKSKIGSLFGGTYKQSKAKKQ